jgi:S-adenosylmethionine decarboxylase
VKDSPHAEATAGRGALIDLAPEIHRQRAIIEGYPRRPISAAEIKQYLSGLSAVLKMKTVMDPVTHRSGKFGEAAWIHWETSGAHFYAWDEPRLFFSVDVYTCKAFEVEDAVAYTKSFFAIPAVEYSNVNSYELDPAIT